MLAQDTAFCFGVPSNTDTAELPIEGFKQLLSQIEAELYQSDVFRGAMLRLEEAQNEAASVQFLLKSVGREAIRLALRQVVQQPDSVETELVEAPLAEVTQAPDQTQKTRIESSDDFDADLLNLVPGWRKRANPSDQIAHEEQQRQLGLNCLGNQIRTAREAQLMSLEELRSKTLVPLHQLQAIEAGHGTHLPEDIYLRGFIRRIAKALNLNTEQLLETVPTPDPVKAILPSWYHPQTKSSSMSFGNLALRPAHLYMGYAALLTGGVAWLSHQPAPAPLPNAIDLNSPRVTTPNARSQDNQSRNANVTLNVAPPETVK